MNDFREVLPQIEIDDSTRIWLEELYDLHMKHPLKFLPFDVSRVKRKLYKKLEKNFDPLKIDDRLARNAAQITPLGIHVVDPEYGIFKKIDLILRVLQILVQEKHEVDEFDISELKSRIRLSDDKITQTLAALRNLNCGFSMGYTENQEGHLVKISVSDEQFLFKLLDYKSIEEFIKECFYKKDEIQNKQSFGKYKELEKIEMKMFNIYSPHYINLERIKELKALEPKEFDLTKLIYLCCEINIAFHEGLYHSVGILLRAILDHCPPIFGKSTFVEVANNHGTKSFKELMKKLQHSSRKIADSYLHTQIRKRESLPTSTQVNFSHELDVLLAEICRVIKE